MFKKISLVVLIPFLVISSFAVQALKSEDVDKIPAPTSEYAQVVLYRTKVAPFARAPKVQINEVTLLRLRNKSYTWFNIEPGEYTLRMKWGGDVRSLTISRPLKLEAGKTYYMHHTGKSRIFGEAWWNRVDDVDKNTAYADFSIVKKFIKPVVDTVTKKYLMENAKK